MFCVDFFPFFFAQCFSQFGKLTVLLLYLIKGGILYFFIKERIQHICCAMS